MGFARGGAETWTPVIIGALIIAQALMTDYELGAVRVIPMRTHLWIDAIAGAFLAASPWILGYADIVWIPHVVVGLAEVAVAAVTDVVPTGVRAGERVGVSRTTGPDRGLRDRPFRENERYADRPSDRTGFDRDERPPRPGV